MKIIEYITTATRDIATQPLRCLLTISAVTLSSALLITLVSIGITTRGAIVGHFEQGSTLSSIVVSANSAVSSGFFSSTVQQTQANADKLSDETVTKLRDIPRVTSATPQVSVWELKSFQYEGSPSSYVATAVATTQDSLSQNKLAAGNWFDTASQEPRIVLGNGYLRALGIQDPQAAIGKKLTFTTVAGYRGIGAEIPSWSADKDARSAFEQKKTSLEATIVGVTEQSLTDSRIYLPMGWGRQIESPRASTPSGETTVDNIEKNGYTNIMVTTDSQDAVAGVAKSINQLGFGAITYQKQIEQINQLSLVMWIILGAVALISLISASLGIINTLLMSVSEQKATIQIWRASGASRGLIKRLYVLQAVILSVIGASIGAAIGYVVCRLINNRIETVLSAQGLSSLQLPNVPLWIISGGIMITVGLAMLAAIYPAHVAARKIVD